MMQEKAPDGYMYLQVNLLASRPFGPPDATFILTCEMCGALVGDTETHNKFHHRNIMCSCPGDRPLLPGNRHMDHCVMAKVDS